MVLRSDNGPAFVGKVVQYLVQKFEIKHVTGAAYRPQSQGVVERKNRVIIDLVKGFAERYPKDAISRIPHLEGALRAMRMKCLGGKCPMEVVMGFRPEMPATLQYRMPVEQQEVSQYVKELVDYLAITHERVFQIQREQSHEGEGTQKGTVDTLQEGDYVVLKKPPRELQGRDKYETKAYDEVFRIGTDHGNKTFELEPLIDLEHSVLRYKKKDMVSADRLVKVTMPQLEDDGFQKYLEISEDGHSWDSYIVKQVAPDGKVKICPEGAPHSTHWVDLTKLRYRWVVYRGPLPEGRPERLKVAQDPVERDDLGPPEAGLEAAQEDKKSSDGERLFEQALADLPRHQREDDLDLLEGFPVEVPRVDRNEEEDAVSMAPTSEAEDE